MNESASYRTLLRNDTNTTKGKMCEEKPVYHPIFIECCSFNAKVENAGGVIEVGDLIILRMTRKNRLHL
jgi:hypothetical protein